MTLRNRIANIKWPYRAGMLYGGQLFSILGSYAAQFSLIWYINEVTDSPLMLGVGTVCAFLPMALLAPFAGVWVDRLSRKGVMICADLFIAAISVLFAALFFAFNLPYWAVFPIIFLRSVGSTFHSPAFSASVPMIVPRDKLDRLAGVNQFVVSGAALAGPIIGSLLYPLLGISGMMLFDVGGAVIATTLLLFIHIPNPPRDAGAEKRHIFKEMGEGMRAISGDRVLLKMTVFMALGALLFMPTSTLFPNMVSSWFGKGVVENGIIETLFSLGLLVSAALVSWRGGFKNKFFQMLLSLLLVGAGFAVAGLLPKNGFIPYAVTVFFIGFSGSLFSLSYSVYVQQNVARDKMGRVFSLIDSLMCYATPFGIVVATPVAEAFGTNVWFAVSGFAMAAVGLIMFLFIKGTRPVPQTVPPRRRFTRYGGRLLPLPSKTPYRRARRLAIRRESRAIERSGYRRIAGKL